MQIIKYMKITPMVFGDRLLLQVVVLVESSHFLYVFNKLTQSFTMSVTPCSALCVRTTYFQCRHQREVAIKFHAPAVSPSGKGATVFSLIKVQSAPVSDRTLYRKTHLFLLPIIEPRFSKHYLTKLKKEAACSSRTSVQFTNTHGVRAQRI